MAITAQLRRFWLNVHLWLGVALLIPVVVLGISGSALEFQDELEPHVFPARYAVSAGPSAAPSDLIASAQTAVGDQYAVANMRFPEHAGAPAIVQARAKSRPIEGRPPQSRRIYLDPATARVLEIADPRGGVFGAMHQLHGQLMIPNIGRKVVGWMGWSMLISSLTGIWLWWPRGAFWKAFAWKRGPIFTFNLHHLVGFWIAIPLAILSATGVYISFPQSARTLTQWVVHEEVRPQRGGENAGLRGGGAPLSHTHLSIDEVAQIARTSSPQMRLAALTLPTRARGDAPTTWRAEFHDDQASTTILTQISDEDGAVRPGGGGNALEGPALVMRRLHDGGDQPMWWRIIIFIAGLAPAILGVTGVIMWLRGNAIERAAKL